jgi:transposase
MRGSRHEGRYVAASGFLPASHAFARAHAESELPELRRAEGRHGLGAGGVRFTLLFEAYLLALAEAMPIAHAAERLGEHATRLWRIVEHYVWRAVEALDLREVRRIAADETSARRGHDYISLFIDMARRKVVYVSEGKDAATLKKFAEFLEAHGCDRRAVTDASIDMGAAFEAEIKQNLPNAEITFDKFHVFELANEAVDQVRRQEARNSFRSRAGASFSRRTSIV